MFCKYCEKKSVSDRQMHSRMIIRKYGQMPVIRKQRETSLLKKEATAVCPSAGHSSVLGA